MRISLVIIFFLIFKFTAIAQLKGEIPKYCQVIIDNEDKTKRASLKIQNPNTYNVYFFEDNINIVIDTVINSKINIYVDLTNSYYDIYSLPKRTKKVVLLKPRESYRVYGIQFPSPQFLGEITVALSLISEKNISNKKLKKSLKDCGDNGSCQISNKCIGKYMSQNPIDLTCSLEFVVEVSN